MESNVHIGSTLDDFLEEEGVLESTRLLAIKEVIAWQLDQAMRDRQLTKTQLAELMHTSRSQVRRMLDPNDGNVTLDTLQRAAAVVGKTLGLQLV